MGKRDPGGPVKVWKFRKYDMTTDEYVESSRYATMEAIARIGRVRFGTFREYSATGTVGAQLKSSERAEHGGP